jgi:hypothetical protein
MTAQPSLLPTTPQPGEMIETKYGRAEVVGADIDTGAPLVRIRRDDKSEAGWARWPSRGPCVYAVVEGI